MQWVLQHPQGVQQPSSCFWELLCILQASERDREGPVHGNPAPWHRQAGTGVIPAACFVQEHHLLTLAGDKGLPGSPAQGQADIHAFLIEPTAEVTAPAFEITA